MVQDYLIVMVVVVELAFFLAFSMCLIASLINKKDGRPLLENPPLLMLDSSAFTDKGNKFRKMFLLFFLAALLWPFALLFVIPAN